MPIVDPVIVIPGVTASTLHDEYPIDHQVVWDMLVHRSPERAMPHPEDRRYEARLPARVRAREVFEVAYQELVEELRRELSAKMDEPVPVYAFAYDWRQRLDIVEQELARFVEEVIARTRLMRHYAKAGWTAAPGVSLIGHSMGGLIVTGYLHAQGTKHPVRKVATIATPFRGSINSIVRMTLGDPKPSEREAARLTPALYHLLPTYPGGVDFGGGPGSIFDADMWQASVKESIAEALRLFGSAPPAAKGARLAEAAAILQAMLDEAKAHDKIVSDFDPGRHGLSSSDWLAFIGVGEPTWQRVGVAAAGKGFEFVLNKADVMNDWDGVQSPAGHTGDGVVPLASAEPTFIAKIATQRYSSKDFEPFEIKDKLLNAASDLHGILPNMNKLQRALARFLKGQPLATKYSSNL